MAENQNIEYKESWRDEYMKWICGFANAQGGTLYIGVNDKGEVCGVDDCKQLMEEIPNKVRDIIGILVGVNLLTDGDKEYIEIKVDSYPHPVSYRGKYYQRSGATNQELKGASLDRLMLRAHGKTWDSVPVPYVTVDDLDNATFNLFRRYAKRSGRMDEDDLDVDNRELLDKLRLCEGDYLKRAAILLFHPDPERFITGAYVKIGFFREDVDLVFQDEVHGNLFQQIKQLVTLLRVKYMKAIISYEGIQRVETYPMPQEALREALLNAVINKDYADHTPIQIRVREDAMEIVNGGILPDGWTIETLLKPHRSIPYNPDIANTFFRSGDIEAWGRGINHIVNTCKHEGFSTPEFIYDPSGFWTIFRYQYPERAIIQSGTKSDMKGGMKSAMKGGMKGGMKSAMKSAMKGGMKSAMKSNEYIFVISRGRLAFPIDSTVGMVYANVKKNPHISITTLANILGINRSAIQKQINNLKKYDIIKRVGPDKGGFWEITAPEEKGGKK